MYRYVARRLALSGVSLLGLTVVIFLLLHTVPGDAVGILAGDQVDQAQIEQMREELGFNRPLPQQYATWLAEIARGEFGDSLFTKRTVLGSLAERAPVTFELSILALTVSVLIALPVGVISALKQDSPIDQGLRFMTILSLALPNFWLGTMVVVFGSIWINWSPHVGVIPLRENPLGNLQQMIVPAIVLGAALAASLTRILRSSMLEVIRDDYIRTARAKGLREFEIIRRHMLKNAMIPAITLFGLQVGTVISGSVIIESIFNLPGMGRYLVDSIQRRDYPVVQGLTLTFGTTIILVNLLTDLTYGWLDPRISYN